LGAARVIGGLAEAEAVEEAVELVGHKAFTVALRILLPLLSKLAPLEPWHLEVLVDL
jgi:hypothetical protein